jgi:hypothetical protein
MSTKIELQNIADTAITAISALGAPKVTQIGYPGNDTAADTAGGQTITLTGTGFQSGLNILIGSVSASVVTFISSTQVTFVSPVSTAGTYVMYVINPDGGTGISIPGISYSGTPAWTTAAGSLGSVTETAAIATTVAATGDAPVTYTLFSGTVPPGSTLNSTTGLLSGTAPASAGATTYSFVIRATDAQNQDTDRSFSLTINSDVVTWSNPAPGATVALAQNVTMSNITLAAVSAAGAAVTYTANALPAGVTLSGNVISGTPTVASTVTTALTATAATTRSAVNVISWTVSVAVDSLLNLTTLLLPGSATTFVRDASTNNLAVTVVGDTRPNTFNPYLTSWSNLFDGSGDFLSITLATGAYSFGTTDFTVEMWINIPSYRTSAANTVMIAGGTNSLSIFLNFSGQLAISQWGVSNIANSTAALQLNQWNHIAVSRQGTTIRLFINGTLDGTATSSANLTGALDTQIGQDPGSSPNTFIGHISNLRVVKGTAVYTAAFTPPTAPLTAIAGTSLLTCQSNRFVDLSTNNFAITRTGDVTVDSFSPFVEPQTTNGSAYFDGTGDYLTVPSSTALNFGTGDFTVECWVYFNSLANTPMIWHKVPGSGGFASGSGWFFEASASILYFGYGTISSSQYWQFSTSLITSTWYHFAVTRVGSSLSIFINGVRSTTTLAGADASVDNSTAFVVGSFQPISANFDLNGYISNFRIVKGTAVYTAAFTPPTAPLTAVANTSLLTLQNNQPTNNSMFLDSSTENFLITRSGNATQGTFSPYSPAGWSNYFDGTGDWLTTPNVSAFDLSSSTTPFTIEAWVYNAGAGTFRGFIGARQNAQGQGWCLYIGTDNTLYIGSVIVGNPYADRQLNTTVIPPNSWAHVALVKTSSGYRGYVNGIAGSLLALTGGLEYQSGQPLIIGALGSQGEFPFLGYISNARIVKGTALYTANFTPSTAPLTAIAGTSLLTCADNRFIDDSPNNFAITRNGDVRVQNFSPFRAVTQTPQTYSAFFDGTGDWLTTPYNAAYAFGAGDFTVEFWVNHNVFDNYEMYIGDVSMSTGRSVWGIGCTSALEGGSSKLYFFAGTSLTTYGATWTPLTNTWYHIAASRSGTSLKLFVNGTQIGSTFTCADNIDNTHGSGTFYIGRVNSSPDWTLNGYISNMRVVKGTAIYTSNFTPPTQPLTAISGTGLLTCQSATFVDNSTNRFAITAAGNSQPSMVNPFGFTFTNSAGYSAANHGGSMYFDGTGDSIRVSNSGTIFTLDGDFTIEAWVYGAFPTGLNGVTIIDTRSVLSASNWSLGVYGNLAGQGAAVNNGLGFIYSETVLGTNIAVIPNQWNHVAVSRSGTTLRMFINGVLGFSGTVSGAIAKGANANAIIGMGADGATYGNTSYISNLRIVKGRALYTANFAPPIAPVQPVPNTVLLLNGTGAAITDATTKNVIETVGTVRIGSVVSKWSGSSMNFPSTESWLKITDSDAGVFGTGNFTIEMWVYFPENLNSVGRLIAFTSSATATAGRLQQASGNGLQWTDASNLGGFGTGANIPISLTTWTHVAICRSGTTLRYFKDGVQVASGSDTSNYTVRSISVGADHNGDWRLTCSIQDLRITKTARYTANFTVPTAPFFTS